MKKYYLIAFCAVLLLAVTGCGKNQVKCTGTFEEGGISIDAELIADFDKADKLTDATIVYTVKDKEKAEQYCALFKLMENADKGVKIECSGNKITIKGYANMESDDEEESETMVGKTKEEFIKAMEELDEQKLTCK